ncbi:MAG: hypothetical protein QOE14_2494, partial [Humisphaera sp.]|nr:hypothetical protein [Humisphaera sp.]
MTRITLAQAIEIALQHHEAGRLAQAAEIYQQVLAQHPQHAEALHLLGAVELQSGRPQRAVELIGAAVALNPAAANFQCNLGEACRTARQFDRAEIALREAIRLDPQLPASHHNMGLLLEETERFADALAEFRAAVAIEPRYLEAHVAMARTLYKMGELDDVVPAAARAVQINPRHAIALTIGGTALTLGGKPSAGAQWLRAALEVDPASSSAWVFLARAMAKLGRHGECVEAHRRAIAADPANPTMRNSLLLTLHYLTDMPPQDVAAEHRAWAAAEVDALAANVPPHANDSDPDRRLRIGYVSGDFRFHAVGLFFQPLLRAHDRNAVEVYCYANVEKKPDAVTEQIKQLADQWRDITTMTDEQAAEKIRADGIDILVDLSGHTAGNRLHVFARRPAPIQVSYLGYPGTTGLRAIGHRITDVLADPPGMTDHLYTEQLVRLPQVFLCYAPPPTAPDV